MDKTKSEKKGWFLKHPWITAILIIISLFTLIGVSSDKNSSAVSTIQTQQTTSLPETEIADATSETVVSTIQTQQTNSLSTSTENSQTNIPVKDVWGKDSGYTVAECNQVCESTYDLSLQVSVCQSNCEVVYGKPSNSLDKYVNSVKDIKRKKE